MLKKEVFKTIGLSNITQKSRILYWRWQIHVFPYTSFAQIFCSQVTECAFPVGLLGFAYS